MIQRYRIYYYSDENGNTPAEDYILSVNNLSELNVIIKSVQRLSRVGLDLLGTNSADNITQEIFELRPNRHRILFSRDGNRFILLSAFLKNTKKTPEDEIIQAEQYREDYEKSRKHRKFEEVIIPQDG